MGERRRVSRDRFHLCSGSECAVCEYRVRAAEIEREFPVPDDWAADREADRDWDDRERWAP